ncbi:MAG: thiol reductant ABC exporter subunit CydD [Dermabacter sp.]|nr:thiol reductant ABC exporter subunit CydD [Dermabacter sp.]
MVRTVVLGGVEAVCVIATAWAVASLGADLLIHRVLPHHNPWPLAVAALALGIRAWAVWLTQRTGHRAATSTIATLRAEVVARGAAAGPRARADGAASTATLATAGLENLRPYLTGYVPQLALSATVTPLALAAIAWWDLTSALVALIAIPLIPIFMILIGFMTEGSSKKSLATMRTLWAETLDLVEGLPTLRALGRARGSERIVAALGKRHKRSSMTTLAFAFLSSFALELIATLGVALIAVSIGLRLVGGSMELFPAIAVLVLAAEVYLPLRMVGQQFHASTDGLAALDAAFEIIDAPAVTHGAQPVPDLRRSTIVIRDLGVQGRQQMAPADLTARLRPGQITALAGGSGQGKSTTIAAILGLLTPTEGSVSIEGPDSHRVALSELSIDELWSQVSWLPQRPVVGPGTVRSILQEASGAPGEAAMERIEAAARATGLWEQVIKPFGWDAPIGRGGVGLSVGQRQRLALTAVLVNPSPLVILDEPTSHLDGASESMIIDVIRTLKKRGSTVLLAAHRPALLAAADEVIHVRAAAADVQDGAHPEEVRA